MWLKKFGEIVTYEFARLNLVDVLGMLGSIGLRYQCNQFGVEILFRGCRGCWRVGVKVELLP